MTQFFYMPENQQKDYSKFYKNYSNMIKLTTKIKNYKKYIFRCLIIRIYIKNHSVYENWLEKLRVSRSLCQKNENAILNIRFSISYRVKH